MQLKRGQPRSQSDAGGPAGPGGPSSPSPATPAEVDKASEKTQGKGPETTEKVIANSIGMKLVLIPAGEFMMGSRESAEELAKWVREDPDRTRFWDRRVTPESFSSEYPYHRVRITKPFYMGVYEVTQAEYERVMGYNPGYFSANGRGKERVAGRDTSRFPVERVGSPHAERFCRKLSEWPGEKAAGRVYRLPTEAEWEYACRAGSETRWCFGDAESELTEYAWFTRNSKGSTHPVGGKKPNAWGLYDMHGNVQERCADWYRADYYKVSPVDDPKALPVPLGSRFGVFRGGSWSSFVSSTRSASRGMNNPGVPDYEVGFRVVAVLSGAGEKGRDTSPEAEKVPAATEKPSPPLEKPPSATQKVIANSMGMKLALIPAGEFMMGSPESDVLAFGEMGEKPQHRVRITRPFYLGIYEVTQGQYERVMGIGRGAFKGDPQWPVGGVSWNDAQEFCRRLSELPEEKAAGAVYRLPTEAEWEYACRAGTTTRYSFGDNPTMLGDYAWWEKNAERTTHPVGQKKPNGWGLYDMHGNVGEWCADWFASDYYAKSSTDDPVGPISGDPYGPGNRPRRVLRGVCWWGCVFPVALRCAYRSHGAADYRSVACGFRVARTATP